MPRITLFRLLLLPPLCWLLLVVLWVSLPSPKHSWDKYPSHRWDGGTLARVYDVDDWWNLNERNSEVKYVRSSGVNSFGLDISYDADAASLLLGWQEAPGVPEARFQVNPEVELFVSLPFLTRVRLGVLDGINMPWFTRADATLLSFEVDHRTGHLPLRLSAENSRVGSGDMVRSEVMVSLWASMGEKPMSYTIESANFTSWEVPSWEIPLLRLLVIFKNDPLAAPMAIPTIDLEFPNAKPSWSPSLTFPIRRAIGKVIIPTGKVTVEVMAVLASIARVLYVLVIASFKAFIFMVGLYVTLVFACWKSKRSPPFWPWASSFWLTRRVVIYIGPTESSSGGSKSGDDHAAETDPEDEGPRTPQPLTSIWGFFTSKSPLDDLLVTFEFTKPFVQPLRWRKQPVPIDDEEKTSPAASSAIRGHANGNSTRSRNASLHHETKAESHQEKCEENLPI